MRLLLDTHIFLAMIGETQGRFSASLRRLLAEPDAEFHLSVASLSEITIKSRLGKLRLATDLKSLPHLSARLRITLVPITDSHAVADVSPEPTTRDPFDRILLAQCQCEALRLVTVDRALVDHPLAVKTA